MEAERRRQLILAVAVVGLVLALYRAWGAFASPTSVVPGAPPAVARQTTGPPRLSAAAPEVHLRLLDDERPKPGVGGRNLFRFKPKPVPAPPRPPARPVPVPIEVQAPTGPPPPPPPPPISLKFIGLVETPSTASRVAVLSDGRSVFQGREGDIIEGRYRILRIGAEAIEMAHLDGRGRQTIRLTGS